MKRESVQEAKRGRKWLIKVLKEREWLVTWCCAVGDGGDGGRMLLLACVVYSVLFGSWALLDTCSCFA